MCVVRSVCAWFVEYVRGSLSMNVRGSLSMYERGSLSMCVVR